MALREILSKPIQFLSAGVFTDPFNALGNHLYCYALCRDCSVERRRGMWSRWRWLMGGAGEWWFGFFGIVNRGHFCHYLWGKIFFDNKIFGVDTYKIRTVNKDGICNSAFLSKNHRVCVVKFKSSRKWCAQSPKHWTSLYVYCPIWIDTSDAVLLIKLSLPMIIVSIMLEWNLMINSSQTGEETDFILVSCTGLGIEPTRREQVLKAKKVSHFFSVFSPIFLFKCSCIWTYSGVSLGWGRFIKKIRPWIHYNSPWSTTGYYLNFVVFVFCH